MAAIDRPEVGAGMSDAEFWDDAPFPVCQLLAFIILDQMTPVRLDDQGYEISYPCTLNDLLFSPEDAAIIERWMKAHFAPDQICDECSRRMGRELSPEDQDDLEPMHMCSLTNSGVRSFFLCEWCGEHYLGDGWDGLPKIMAKLDSLELQSTIATRPSNVLEPKK